MTTVDLLLVNGTLVTMDTSYTVIQKGAVAIKDDSIVAVGPTDELTQEYQGVETFDCTNLTLIPGLINAHTHVPMALLRGLADDLRLDVWLIGYMMPVEREFVNEEFVHLGTLLGCAEMIQSGITTFADMYYYEDSVASATVEAGMRAILGQTILKFPSPDADSYEESLTACETFIEKWRNHPLIIPAVAPHAPYTCTEEILKECTDLAIKYDVPLHIHVSETVQEVEEWRDKYGMPVVPWIKKQKMLRAKVIAAHCVHIDEGEINTLQHNDVGVAHNPTSNLKLASGMAPIKTMLDTGLKVGIGTDGVSSNNDLDMLEETRLAAFVAKVSSDDPTALPAKQALTMATRMGAEALHIGEITGSLEAGKRADIAFLDLNRLHTQPSFRRDSDAIYAQIVYTAKSTDVQHVLCNGQWLMRDREVLTVDIDSALVQANELAEKIDAFLIEREDDIVSKLLAIGELEQGESFEVQVKAKLVDTAAVEALLERKGIKIVKRSHYRQYDTYFEFGAPDNYRLRYREDDFLGDNGKVTSVRTRLTLTSEGKEHEFENAIVLSRSRFISQATRPLRFYREYVQANSETTVIKERRRWHIDYRGFRIYINIDTLIEPEMAGHYLEIKSRTWSKTDAREKAEAISELLRLIGIDDSALVKDEYVALA